MGWAEEEGDEGEEGGIIMGVLGGRRTEVIFAGVWRGLDLGRYLPCLTPSHTHSLGSSDDGNRRWG